MKYGMNLLLWTIDVTEEHHELLQKLKNMGYDAVELAIFDDDIPKYEKIGKTLDEIGLERTCVTIVSPEANPISDSPEIRQAGLDKLKRALDNCAAAGIKQVSGPLHSPLGEFTFQPPTEDEWTRAKEVLYQVGEHAKQLDIMLGVEYLNRFECYFLNCAADTAKFVREIGHPNVKMMYDTFHANIEEKDIAESIRDCADQLVFVHISENDRSTPGHGHVHWETTFKTLKEVGYDNWFVVEAFGTAFPELAAPTKIWRRMYDTEEKLAEDALKFMKQNWEG